MRPGCDSNFRVSDDWARKSTPELAGLPDLQYSRGLDDRRLSLPLSKLHRLLTGRVNAGEPLAVFVEDGNLPVLVLAPLVFSELRTLTCSFSFWHSG